MQDKDGNTKRSDMKKFGILMALGVLAAMPQAMAQDGANLPAAPSEPETTIIIDPTATKATTTEVQGADGTTTVITTQPAAPAQGTTIVPPAEGQTTVVVEPKEETGPRDAITGEIVKPKVEEKPEEMSLRDKVRSKMKESKTPDQTDK